MEFEILNENTVYAGFIFNSQNIPEGHFVGSESEDWINNNSSGYVIVV